MMKQLPWPRKCVKEQLDIYSISFLPRVKSVDAIVAPNSKYANGNNFDDHVFILLTLHDFTAAEDRSTNRLGLVLQK